MSQSQRYVVVEECAGFELRQYPAHLRAEIDVEGSFAEAANRAFGALAGFISGRNDTKAKVAMTAPVVQQSVPSTTTSDGPADSTAQTVPGRHLVGFIMPAELTSTTVPVPTDPRITVRTVPAQLMAARAFGGRWTESVYEQQLSALLSAIADARLQAAGMPQFARFDPPWRPWFLRRNEVLIPVTGHRSTGSSSEPVHNTAVPTRRNGAEHAARVARPGS